jgi:probable addiction module antidote protein
MKILHAFWLPEATDAFVQAGSFRLWVEALLMALRQVAQAQGMDAVAARAAIQRESLYRALSPKGNPTLKTLLAILDAAGLRLAVTRREETQHAA